MWSSIQCHHCWVFGSLPSPYPVDYSSSAFSTRYAISKRFEGSFEWKFWRPWHLIQRCAKPTCVYHFAYLYTTRLPCHSTWIGQVLCQRLPVVDAFHQMETSTWSWLPLRMSLHHWDHYFDQTVVWRIRSPMFDHVGHGRPSEKSESCARSTNFLLWLLSYSCL